MSTFVMRDAVRQEGFDYTIGWRLVSATGARQLVVMDVILRPGGGHDFHRHPAKEEMMNIGGRAMSYSLGPGKKPDPNKLVSRRTVRSAQPAAAGRRPAARGAAPPQRTIGSSWRIAVAGSSKPRLQQHTVT
jgi:hypothetical protein